MGNPQLSKVETALAGERLTVLGGFNDEDGALLLVGPDEPAGFWAHVQASREGKDGAPDPIDRWSRRVLDAAAQTLGGTAIYPFGGPPYHPFFTWALKTRRIYESPVKLLVHDRAGLWVSFRGALRFGQPIVLPPQAPSPCLTCSDKPCLNACPVDALTEKGYDVPACKSYLGRTPSAACWQGCRVRAVCPVSQGWGRDPDQARHHMEYFQNP